MTKLVGLAAAAAMLVAGSVHAEEAKGGASKTVSGELIDSACYFGGDKKGPGHRKCADMCIKGGAPMGVLAADGTVYIMLADHSKEKPYEDLKGMAAEQVEVTGTDVTKGGVNALVVSSVKKLSK